MDTRKHNPIICSECNQQYTPGTFHECVPLHVARGYKPSPKNTLPKGHKYNELDERLEGPDGMPGTGLTRREIIIQGGAWWDKKGRYLVFTHAIKHSHEQDFIPSGIMQGQAFDDLNALQKAEVAGTWYEQVWLPRERGEPDDAPMKEGAIARTVH